MPYRFNIFTGNFDHVQDLSGYVLSSDLSDTTSGSAGCTLVGIPALAGATWTNQCNHNSLFGSSGRATGGNVTDASLTGGTAETVNVAAGTGFIKATDSDTAELLSFDWDAVSEIAIPTNTVRYIMVKYGTPPTAQIATLESDWDLDTSWPLAKVVNEGGTLHILNNPWWVTDGTTNIIERLQAEGIVVRDKHVGGLALSIDGSRQVAVTAGVLWSRLNEFPFATSNAGDTFETYYRSGAAAWTDADLTVVPITQYNRLSDNTLQTIDNNKYFNWWFYIETDNNSVAAVYPQNTYNTFAEAEVATPPSSIPVHISENGILIGRAIFKQGVATVMQVDSAWEQVFTASAAADHGNLAGLADDDHTQYLLATGTRTGASSQAQIFTNGIRPANLTDNGFVKTSGGNGTLSVDTSAYITGITWSGITGTQTDINLSGFTNDSSFISTSDLWYRGGTVLTAQNEGDDLVIEKGKLGINLEVGDTPGKELDVKGHMAFLPVAAPTSALTGTLSGTAGNVDNGTHRYKTTYYNAIGETNLSSTYEEVIVVDKSTSGQVNITDLPISPDSSVIGRKIYRGKGGVSTSNYYLHSTVADNTTTAVVDNVADADIGTADNRNRDNFTAGEIYKSAHRFGFMGVNNFALGYLSFNPTTDPTGYFNFGLGGQSLLNLTSGSVNTCVGTYSGQNLTTASSTTAVGAYCLTTLVGGYDNTAVGQTAMRLCSGGRQCVAVGSGALYSYIGSYGTALGYQAAYSTTSGTGVIAIGRQTLHDATTATGMTVVGYRAGYYPNNVVANKCTTSTYCTFIGYDSGLGSSTQRIGAIAIGYNATVDAAYTCALGGTGAQAVDVCIGYTTAREVLDVNGNVRATGYKSNDGSAGATGSFTTVDSKTVTVKDGLITSIV